MFLRYFDVNLIREIRAILVKKSCAHCIEKLVSPLTTKHPELILSVSYSIPIPFLYLNNTLLHILVRLFFVCCPFIERTTNGQQTDIKRCLTLNQVDTKSTKNDS